MNWIIPIISNALFIRLQCIRWRFLLKLWFINKYLKSTPMSMTCDAIRCPFSWSDCIFFFFFFFFFFVEKWKVAWGCHVSKANDCLFFPIFVCLPLRLIWRPNRSIQLWNYFNYSIVIQLLNRFFFKLNYQIIQLFSFLFNYFIELIELFYF